MNNLRAGLMIAVCGLLAATVSAAQPAPKTTPAPATRPAETKNIQSACDAIARGVREIEQQAPKLRKIDIKDEGSLVEVLGTCCIDVTLFMDGPELRKAVVQSWHGLDGFVAEWYFAGGKPIFVVETSRYQVFEQDLLLAGAKRVSREVVIPKDEADAHGPGIPAVSHKHSKAEPQPKLVYCRWQDRYYMDAGRAIRATSDYPGKDPGIMPQSLLKQTAAAIADLPAKSHPKGPEAVARR